MRRLACATVIAGVSCGGGGGQPDAAAMGGDAGGPDGTDAVAPSCVAPSSASPLPTAFQTATLDIDLAHPKPLPVQFSGIGLGVSPISFKDPQLLALSRPFAPGMIRFMVEWYDWETGHLDGAQLASHGFQTSCNVNAVWETCLDEIMQGVGGVYVQDAAGFASSLGASFMYTVNIFDDPAHTQALAQQLKAKNVSVDTWELGNELWYTTPTSSCPSPCPNTGYAAQAKPHADAIRSVFPQAKIALMYAQEVDGATIQYNQALASYPSPYWNAATFHFYPGATGDFLANAQVANAQLALVDSLVSGLVQKIPPGASLTFSEFNWTYGSPLTGTLFLGLYAADLTMRLAAQPRMEHALYFDLTSNQGNVYDTLMVTNDHAQQIVMDQQAQPPHVDDTVGWDFAPLVTTPGAALEILNPAINGSTLQLAVTVAGGDQVSSGGSNTIPALGAGAYVGADRSYLVIVNRSPHSHAVTVTANGSAIHGPLQATWISSTDATLINNPNAPLTVVPQKVAVGNPVFVPAYSVMRVEQCGGF